MTGVVITSLLDLVTLMASALEMALSLRGVRDIGYCSHFLRSLSMSILGFRRQMGLSRFMPPIFRSLVALVVLDS